MKMGKGGLLQGIHMDMRRHDGSLVESHEEA